MEHTELEASKVFKFVTVFDKIGIFLNIITDKHATVIDKTHLRRNKSIS